MGSKFNSSPRAARVAYLCVKLFSYQRLRGIGVTRQKGSWTLSTNGQATLGTPNGTCNVNGTVLAFLNDVLMDLTSGNIMIHNLGISIGATNCSSPNFQGKGTYTVADKGDGNFEVTGTFEPQFVGRPAACSGTILKNVTFTITGKSGSRTANFEITGLESGSYAEGPPAGPLSCTAPILNLTGNGTATQL